MIMRNYIMSKKEVIFKTFFIVAVMAAIFTGCSSHCDAADHYDPVEKMKSNCWAAFDEIIVGFDYFCNHNVINISEVTEIGNETVVLRNGVPNYLVQLGSLNLEWATDENEMRYEFYYDLTSQTILAYRCVFATSEDNEAWRDVYVPLLNTCYETMAELPIPEGTEIELCNNRIDEVRDGIDFYEYPLAEGSPDVRVTIGTRHMSCNYVELFCEAESARMIGWNSYYGQK